jgi:LemA protein
MNIRTGALTTLAVIVLIVVVAVMAVAGSYNQLVSLDQTVQSQWGQVENTYQRRADLIPNLVATVKGAANFEKSTYIAVAEARAKVGQVRVSPDTNAPVDQSTLDRFAQAQNGLSSALSRLLVVSENYPELKANENFRDLQAQLEGTENRIAVERMRYNEVAQDFNTTRNSFPTVFIAGYFGTRFHEKPYFKSEPGGQTAPHVKL